MLMETNRLVAFDKTRKRWFVLEGLRTDADGTKRGWIAFDTDMRGYKTPAAAEAAMNALPVGWR